MFWYLYYIFIYLIKTYIYLVNCFVKSVTFLYNPVDIYVSNSYHSEHVLVRFTVNVCCDTYLWYVIPRNVIGCVYSYFDVRGSWYMLCVPAARSLRSAGHTRQPWCRANASGRSQMHELCGLHSRVHISCLCIVTIAFQC